MVSGYFSGYQQTDGVQDGKDTDFVNGNVNKEQSVVVLASQLKRR